MGVASVVANFYHHSFTVYHCFTSQFYQVLSSLLMGCSIVIVLPSHPFGAARPPIGPISSRSKSSSDLQVLDVHSLERSGTNG